jgi:hypothetical protein
MRYIMKIEARVEIEADDVHDAYAKLDAMSFRDIVPCSIKPYEVGE